MQVTRSTDAWGFPTDADSGETRYTPREVGQEISGLTRRPLFSSFLLS